MNEQELSQLHEYWKQEQNKIEKEYDLARKERRVTKWLKENSDRINCQMRLRFCVGMNTFYSVNI